MRTRVAWGRCVVIVGLAASGPAWGWSHTGSAWAPEDFPLPYWVADDGTSPNTPARCAETAGLEGCCEETVPAGYCTEATKQSFEAWHAAECAGFSSEHRGVSPNFDLQTGDGLFYVSFNDPNQTQEAGVLGTTTSIGGGPGVYINGVRYDRFVDVDIALNDAVPFTTHEAIVAGDCNGEVNLRGVMAHEIGHALGMDHSCEGPGSDTPCTDPVLDAATMRWSEPNCAARNVTINTDDIAGLSALYGPSIGFACSHDDGSGASVGVVPFDLNCVIVSDHLSEVVAAAWTFGDGGTADGIAASHTYTEPGNYTVQVEVQGEGEACGPDGWSGEARRVGYVRACGVPEAAFEIRHVDRLQYQLFNESDVSVYGCISNIRWTLYEGEGTDGPVVVDDIAAWEPIVDLPHAGTYTAVMNLGGIGGTGAAVATFRARDHRGAGRRCATAGPAGPVGGVFVLFGGAVLARRRRSSGGSSGAR